VDDAARLSDVQLRRTAARIPPEILEPVRGQRRVDGGAGDRPMAKPSLDRPDVVALVGEGIAAGVSRPAAEGMRYRIDAPYRRSRRATHGWNV
jgi:hypothetical protein